MTARATPYQLDGVLSRLRPHHARSLAMGPGHLGRGGVPGAILWAAGIDIWQADQLAVFFAEEADHIDWLAGFLCDQAMTDLFDLLAHPPEEPEEEEEMFARGSMNTLGSDVVDD